jgi:quercetin dioxygenase-like cupin family protein
MAIHFNESEVVSVAAGEGVRRQTLLDKARIPGIKFVLDRLVLAPGSALEIDVAPSDLAWFQMLEGAATLRGAHGEEKVGDTRIGLLPPGFRATLATAGGATLLLARVPDAAALDPSVVSEPPPYRTLDWRDEPLLKSEHDARKRIYIVTPKMFGIRAIRGEMIIYPPGTECPVHHHEGGAHFMYFIAGSGTCFGGDDQPIPVRKGDIVYYEDREPHWVRGGTEGDMIFSEFFVPSAVATVWADPSKVCTWHPMGVNYRGGTPSREIKSHAHSQYADV